MGGKKDSCLDHLLTIQQSCDRKEKGKYQESIRDLYTEVLGSTKNFSSCEHQRSFLDGEYGEYRVDITPVPAPVDGSARGPEGEVQLNGAPVHINTGGREF